MIFFKQFNFSLLIPQQLNYNLTIYWELNNLPEGLATDGMLQRYISEWSQRINLQNFA